MANSECRSRIKLSSSCPSSGHEFIFLLATWSARYEHKDVVSGSKRLAMNAWFKRASRETLASNSDCSVGSDDMPVNTTGTVREPKSWSIVAAVG